MTTATESFLSQLDKAAEGKSYNLIEFEGLLESMKGDSVEVEEEVVEELVEEVVEEIIVEEPEEEKEELIAADMELAMGELQGLFEGISGMDLTEPEPEPEPEIVLESIEPVEEAPQPQIQIDPAVLEAVTEELKGLFSGVAGYDLFAPPPPEPEPEPELDPETILENNFFEPLEDTALSISEKYAGLPIVSPKYEISETSQTLISHAAGKMNTSTPVPKDFSYEKYDPSVAQGDANWQMDLFGQRNAKAAQMVNDVSQLLEKHKRELPEEEYKILEGNAVEQAAQYLSTIQIEEEVVERSPEEIIDSKIRGIVNNVLATNVGWGQRGMTYGSGEVKLAGLDDVDVAQRSATKQFLAWDASVSKFVSVEGTTPVGDITGVTAGTGLSGGGNQGVVTLNLDASELTALGTTADMTDYVVIQDATDNTTKKVLVSNLPANEGVITGVQAGTGLSGGGSSGTVTVNLDTVSVALGGTGATSASGARTGLGVAIGSDVQAYSAILDTVAGGTYVGDNSIVTVGTVGTGTWQGTAIADSYLGTGINATKLADGSITNTEIQYINSLTSNAQTQIDSKADKGFVTAMSMALG